jgi:hypothetical protein
MMTTYWFRPKRYGYGATPVTWQGWVVVLAAVLTMVAVSLFLRLTEPQGWSIAAMLAFDAAVLIALAVICRRKTEGQWRWRWGDR